VRTEFREITETPRNNRPELMTSALNKTKWKRLWKQQISKSKNEDSNNHIYPAWIHAILSVRLLRLSIMQILMSWKKF